MRAANSTGSNWANFTDGFGNTYWFSYQTLIAFGTDKAGLVIRENVWGTTTGKHLNAIDDDKSNRVDKATFEAIYEKAFAK